MRVVAVTDTSNSVGKTVVMAALAACAMVAGGRSRSSTPVQTGVTPGEPGDLDDVARLTGASDLHEYARFRGPLAPGTAARRVGVRAPRVPGLAERIGSLAARNLVLIEGAGGPLVAFNAAGETLVDLVRALGPTMPVEVVLVASAGLGALNLAALTAQVLSSTGLPLAAVVVGDWPADPDLAARCNLVDLPRYACAERAGAVPDQSGRLGRAVRRSRHAIAHAALWRRLRCMSVRPQRGPAARPGESGMPRPRPLPTSPQCSLALTSRCWATGRPCHRPTFSRYCGCPASTSRNCWRSHTGCGCAGAAQRSRSRGSSA